MSNRRAAPTITVTRRLFLSMLGVGATAASVMPAHALGTWLRLPETFQVKELAEGVWLILDHGGNVLFIRTDEGPVVIDTKLANVGLDLADLASRTAGRASVTVINTHHHADHTGGNWAFAGQAKFIAQENLKPRLAEMMSRFATDANRVADERVKAATDDATRERAQRVLDRLKDFTVEDIAPDIEFSETHTLKVGGRTFELRHFGNGHTDNDTVVYMPEENIVHMGDLLFHKLWPFIDRSAKADTRGWQRSLEKTIELIDTRTVVIPGHGEVTNPHGLRAKIAFFDQLREVVGTSIRAGLTKEQVVALEPAAFADLGFPQMRPRTLSAMYEEIQASW